MDKISCSIARDLLPLYLDGVVSADTAQAVGAHLEQCEACREEYRLLKKQLPMAAGERVQMENSRALRNFKHSWRRKKIALACTAVLLSSVIFVAGTLVYQNVGAVHDFFSPRKTAVVRRAEGEWMRLTFDGSETLTFDSLFCEMEAVNDGNSSGPVTLRIAQADGEVLVDELTLQPGGAAKLDALRRGVEYTVDMQAQGEYFVISFY